MISIFLDVTCIKAALYDSSSYKPSCDSTDISIPNGVPRPNISIIDCTVIYASVHQNSIICATTI